VADFDNSRVLRFDNAASKANGAAADGVLGQTNFTTVMPTPLRRDGSALDVAVDNTTGRLYISELGNNRVLVFNAAAGLANGANASFVLGQTNFTTGTPNTGGISASTLDFPQATFFDPVAKVCWLQTQATTAY